ncbi:MAG: hypothetical protein LBH37_04220 [Oscillospiraceae bacterium]|jgi:hypothetical protein|nr:hypothetical protein [Oscillospiraceae bacterium]
MKRDVKVFVEDLSRNKDLKSELKKLRDKYKPGILNAKDSYIFLNEDLIPFAKSRGYNFTLNDYVEYELEVERDGIDFRDISGGMGPMSKKNVISETLALGTVSDIAGFYALGTAEKNQDSDEPKVTENRDGEDQTDSDTDEESEDYE